GVIDSVLFDTLPSSAADIAKLTCLPRPSLLSVTPVDPAAVPPGTAGDDDVHTVNNSCEDAQFNFNAFTFSFDPSIIVNPSGAYDIVPATHTRHLPSAVSASEAIYNFGTFQIGVHPQLPLSSSFEYFNEVVNF